MKEAELYVHINFPFAPVIDIVMIITSGLLTANCIQYVLMIAYNAFTLNGNLHFITYELRDTSNKR